MKYEHDEMEIDLRELYFVLRKRIVAILLTGMIFAGVAGVYSFFIAEPIYQSTARLYITTQSTSLTSLADIQIGTVLTYDYVELIQSRTLIEEVIVNLGMEDELSAGNVKSRLTVYNPENTRILNISIKGPDPEQNKLLANEFAKVARHKISEVMKTDEPSLWETAVSRGGPIKPDKTKNMALGLIIGLFLASLVVVISHLMNDAIKTNDDAERYLDLMVLGTIPYEGVKSKARVRKKANKESRKRHKKRKRRSSSGDSRRDEH